MFLALAGANVAIWVLGNRFWHILCILKFYGVLSLWWEALAPDVMSKEVEAPQAVCWFSFVTQVPELKAFGLQEENMYVSSFSRSKCHILVLGNRFWHILCILWSSFIVMRGIGARCHVQRSRGSASCLLISFVCDTSARVKSFWLAGREHVLFPALAGANVTYWFLETDSGTFYAFYGVSSSWWEASTLDVMSKEVEAPQAVCWFLSFMTQVPELKAFGLQEENMYVSSFSRSKCHILVLGNRFWHILCILWSSFIVMRGIDARCHVQRSRGSASCLLISFLYDTSARVKIFWLAGREQLLFLALAGANITYWFLETDSGTFYAFYGVPSSWWEASEFDVMSLDMTSSSDASHHDEETP